MHGLPWRDIRFKRNFAPNGDRRPLPRCKLKLPRFLWAFFSIGHCNHTHRASDLLWKVETGAPMPQLSLQASNNCGNPKPACGRRDLTRISRQRLMLLLLEPIKGHFPFCRYSSFFILLVSRLSFDIFAFCFSFPPQSCLSFHLHPAFIHSITQVDGKERD